LLKEGEILDTLQPTLSERIKMILSRRRKTRLVSTWRKPSGVLIPFYQKDGQYFLVFTRRSQLVHHHKGEISFPGGGYHASDGNLKQTALRETWEEIGLEPTSVDVLGELDDTPTKGSAFIITPFVGLIPADYSFKLSDFEIGQLIHMPVDALLVEDCLRIGPEIILDGSQYGVYEYTFQGQTVIGATARILKQFLEIYCQASTQRM
jgi:8-oxo-dGTP pyrophosphatase MutT (NUDIX family)